MGQEGHGPSIFSRSGTLVRVGATSAGAPAEIWQCRPNNGALLVTGENPPKVNNLLHKVHHLSKMKNVKCRLCKYIKAKVFRMIVGVLQGMK